MQPIVAVIAQIVSSAVSVTAERFSTFTCCSGYSLPIVFDRLVRIKLRLVVVIATT